MRTLHLFSNSKWTGPAEPALNLCIGLRALGIGVDFACAPGVLGRNEIIVRGWKAGIEPIIRLRLGKHRHPLRDALDRRVLARMLRETRYDLIHCHLDNDHLIAARPAAAMDIPIVRSSYYGEGFPETAGQARLLRSATAIIEPSERALKHDVGAFGLRRERVHVVPGAVDTLRFDPARPLPDARARLGIPEDAFVAGIVARLQAHRHFDDLWNAIARLASEFPELHVLVIGRGTKQEQVGFAPVRALGIEDRVHFTGYMAGDDYVAALQAFTVKVFLMPGSDGTCRAAREAMAMGKPVIAADRGMLPEIVTDGQDGRVFDRSAPALEAALREFLGDPAKTAAMGRAARATAASRYTLGAQASAVAAIYTKVLQGRGGRVGHVE